MPHALRDSMCRAARARRVFLVEQAIFTSGDPVMEVELPVDGLAVARPCLPHAVQATEVARLQRSLLDSWLTTETVEPGILWYQSPAAVDYSAHLAAPLTVYDCVDRAGSAAALPLDFRRLEYALLERADVVFTDTGTSRHALRLLHPNVRRVNAWCSRTAVDELLRELSRPRVRTAQLAMRR